MQLSVIICTHNPRGDYLKRVLDALKAQTLPKEQWELLLVDNASKEPLADNWDLSWHPHGQHVREMELGLTPARLRGIKESAGDLLVFVDDDNVLAENYLDLAVETADRHSFVGIWSGNIRGEFEEVPSPDITPYLHLLAIRNITRDVWANYISAGEAEPCGAGMCVRRVVALKYATELNENPRRKLLDRRGSSLSSGGDTDMAYTACEMGLAMGQFRSLRVLHLIPKRRLEEQYILKLIAEIQKSNYMRSSLRNILPNVRRGGFKEWLRFVYHSISLRGFRRKVYWEERKSSRPAADN